ncbi:hypothetical protein SCHIN_v1c11770 [Spiroplasma chinense]|uniref:Transmembrane protein n=1 Tax=Spiroplasma chinense TaxID=216932 RepID=A0A5B9Y5Y4_9MOLU|nr:hypothetical protein [Spiroplasma chinense]QEH62370.1 hypothetical protein SCHIN_v1c11770 [Spiroplasma chinense]
MKLKNSSFKAIKSIRVSILSKSIKACLIFAFIFIPSIAFIGIVYANPNFKLYVNNFSTFREVFDKSIVPSKNLIFTLIWVGLGLVLLALIIIIFTKQLLVLIDKSIFWKNVHFVLIVTLLVCASICFAFAAYSYSLFYDLYVYLANVSQGDHVLDNEKMAQIAQKFSVNFAKTKNFKWSDENLTWWVCLFQILMVIIYFSAFYSNLDRKQDDEIESLASVKKNLDQSKVAKLIGRLSINNNKNVSIWLIISTMIVFIPQFIFVIKLSMQNSYIHSLLDWTFKAPYLLQVEDLNEFDRFKSLRFTVSHLPIIATGFLLATMCIFGLVYFKGIKATKGFFITQFVILFIELICVISVNTYVMYEINSIVKFWNDNGLIEKLSKYQDNFANIEDVRNNIFEQEVVKYPWLRGQQYVSQVLISVTFVIVTYTILGSKMKKLYKFPLNPIK